MTRQPFAGRALRVALLSSARTWRGSTVSLVNIADGLTRRGHYAELLVGEESNREIIQRRGNPVSLLPTRNTGWAEVRELRRALQRSGIRAIIADRPRDLRLASLAGTGLGIRLIYRYNVSRPRPPSDLLTRMAYRRVATTIFRTAAGARQTLEAAPFMGRRPWLVIPGGVDTSVFFPDLPAGEQFRARHGLGPGPVLIAVGALMPEKRYPEMLQVISQLGTPVPLLICGEGKMEAELRQRARELGVDAHFLGLLSPNDMRAAYNAATLLVHTCAVETFGLSVSEAMACARPVVAAASGALPEVVGDAGVLVIPGDLPEFARQIAILLADSAACRVLGERGRIRSVAEFSLERMVAKYEELLLALEAAS